MRSLHHSHDWRLSISLVSFKSGPVIADMYVNNAFANCWGPKLFSCRGLGFLSMSIPPVLSKATGTCSVYENECVDKQIAEIFGLLT